MLPWPEQIAVSPCCGAFLEEFCLDVLACVHWRCRECRGLYTWNGHELLPCDNRMHKEIIFVSSLKRAIQRRRESGRNETRGALRKAARAAAIIRR